MSDYCSIQICKFDEPVSRYVQFPFLIKNESIPSFCGYPGFDLFCNGDDKLLIDLDKLGAFSVEEIDYIKQELWLNDPEHCLPRKLLSLNGSSFVGKSQFLPIMEQDYWFINCSSDFFTSSNDLKVEPIECLSGINYGVFATQMENITKGSSSMCSKIGPIKVPKGAYEGNSSILSGNIRLTWSRPHTCARCYEKNGRCRFKRSSNLEVECFFPRHGMFPLSFLYKLEALYYYWALICYRLSFHFIPFYPNELFYNSFLQVFIERKNIRYAIWSL
ncbi:putative RING-H2 finger protein ATL21A [Bienertia sinuspersici]